MAGNEERPSGKRAAPTDSKATSADRNTAANLPSGDLPTHGPAKARSPSSSPAVGVGSQIGPYELIEKLGQGGMGAVYKATHAKLKKIVAVKVLPPHAIGDDDTIARFEREMEAVGKISHPNIVQALDADEIDGIHFLAMEFVEGSDLSRLVKKRGPFSVANTCKIVRQVALGLAAAHAAGLVHRDIKPSNLLLTKDGRVKILDLGLARVNNGDAPSRDLTVTGQTFGTPDFMAPEQWDDTHAADARADLYALGCTLYYLLTGKAPYSFAQTVGAKLKAHMLSPIPGLAVDRPEVPEGLARIYERLLAKDPGDRIQSASELIPLLLPFATDNPHANPVPGRTATFREQIGAKQGDQTAPPPSFPFIEPGSPHASSLTSPKRKRNNGPPSWIVWSMLLGSAAMIIGTAALLTRNGGHPPSNPDPPKSKEIAKAAADKPANSSPTAVSGSPETGNQPPRFNETGLPPLDNNWRPPELIPVGDSPFDKLDHDAIPNEERFEYQPKELVSVLGSHAGKQWGPNYCIAISPNGRRLITTAGNRATLWESHTKSVLATFSISGAWWSAGSIAFLNDNQFVDLDGKVWVIAETDVRPVAPRSDVISGFEFPLDPALVATCEGGQTLCVTTQTGHVVLFDVDSRSPSATDAIDDVLPAGQHSYLAEVSNHLIYLDANRHVCRRTISKQRFGEKETLPLQFASEERFDGVSPDGTQCIATDLSAATIWNISHFPPAATKLPPRTSFYRIVSQFSRDGKWLAFSGQGSVFLARRNPEIDTTRPIALDSTAWGQSAIAFSHDSSLAVVANHAGIVRIWDISGTSPVETVPYNAMSSVGSHSVHGSGMSGAFGFQNDSKRLFLPVMEDSRSTNRRSCPFEFQAAALVPVSSGHALVESSTLGLLVPTNDNRGITFGTYGRRNVSHSFDGVRWNDDTIFGEADAYGEISANRERAFTISRVTADPLNGWDITSKLPKQLWTLPLGPTLSDTEVTFIRPIVVAKNLRLLALLRVGTDAWGGASLYLVKGLDANPQIAATIKLPLGANRPRTEYRMAISPSGHFLAHTPKGTRDLVLTDLRGATPRDLQAINDPVNVGPIRWLEFSPNEQFLAFASDDGIGLLTARDLSLIWSWKSPGPVDWIDWTPDGRHLLTHNSNQTVYVLRLDEKLLADASGN